MACNESTRVNVGDPLSTHKDGVLGNKPKSRGFQESQGEVRDIIVPMKRGNARRGKDVG